MSPNFEPDLLVRVKVEPTCGNPYISFGQGLSAALRHLFGRCKSLGWCLEEVGHTRQSGTRAGGQIGEYGSDLCAACQGVRDLGRAWSLCGHVVDGERHAVTAVHLEDAAAVAAQDELLVHVAAGPRCHRGGDEHPVRGRIGARAAVGGVVSAACQQDIALVEPRIPEAVQHQDCPVHRPVRQADVEPAILGQPIAGESEQFRCRRHEAAEGCVG